MAVFYVVQEVFIPRRLIVPWIIKINIIVFFMWMIFSSTHPQLMINNFLVSWDFLAQGRLWTLVTSVFSHNMLFHLLINMYVFFGFGSAVEGVLGSRRFLRFYLISGILGSLGHCLVSTFLLHQPELPALGASGAVAGVILLFALMFPKEKLLLLGIIPIPALVGALLFVAFDIWGLIAQTRGSSLPIGYGAHLGGAIFGAGYYYFFIRQRPLGQLPPL
jgi:membrane associated rhomboid family serine protease